MFTATTHLARWDLMWQQLVAANPGVELLTELLQRYAEPQRHYHTLQHLDECFAQFDLISQNATHPAEVALALWFHDAIYAAKRHDNEERCADWVRLVLLRAGGSTTAADRVHALVMVTCHNALPTTVDEQILVDIDLSILAATPERFAEYETQVRAEYAWVPEQTYRSKRATILQTFLDRENIYNTDYFKASSEENARSNLAASISNLRRT